MASMFLAEHIRVRAILAMTESGGTARYSSRFRTAVPIFGLSRHDGARRRMALMRDVFPIAFDSRGLPTREAARGRSGNCSASGCWPKADRVLITSGDHMELHGATNTLRLLQVGPGGWPRAWVNYDRGKRKHIGWIMNEIGSQKIRIASLMLGLGLAVAVDALAADRVTILSEGGASGFWRPASPTSQPQLPIRQAWPTRAKMSASGLVTSSMRTAPLRISRC